ncbi:MAG: hypothetical protein WC319_06650 [Candidatus Paceibacterota bacterium]
MWLEAFIIAFLSFLYLEWKEDGHINVKSSIAITIIGTMIGGIILSALFYLWLPAFVGILWGWYQALYIPVLIGSMILMILCIAEKDWKGITVQIIKFGIITIFGLTIITTGYFHGAELYAIPQVTTIDNITVANGALDPIDLKHVRLVDLDLAYSLGKNVIGDPSGTLGSIYQIEKNEMTLQLIKGHEFYVAPLEFQDYWKWDNKRTSPGFVMVDAENPYTTPQIFTGYDMKYMPSAYWGDYLNRYVYEQGYQNCRLQDFTFEITDNLQPYWTVTKTHPTVNNDGYVVDSVVVVNPETGNIKEYPLGSIPDWIDRVTPHDIAIDYATWNGALVHGWWNAYGFVNIHQDVNELTSFETKGGDSNKMFFVTGSNGRPYWFGGMTAASSSSQSLTSIILVDAKDPRSILKIRMTGANEQVALDAVNSQFTNFPDRFGTAIIPYNIYGELTYIIPIDSHTNSGNIYQGVGFVDAMDKHAVTGLTKERVAEEYIQYLASKKIQIALTSESGQKFIEGKVVRIGSTTIDGLSSYRLLLNDSNIIFSINPTLFPMITLTYSDDEVNITYIETGSMVVEASNFSNHAINVRISPEQIALDSATDILNAQQTDNWDKQQAMEKEIATLRKD